MIPLCSPQHKQEKNNRNSANCSTEPLPNLLKSLSDRNEEQNVTESPTTIIILT